MIRHVLCLLIVICALAPQVPAQFRAAPPDTPPHATISHVALPHEALPHEPQWQEPMWQEASPLEAPSQASNRDQWLERRRAHLLIHAGANAVWTRKTRATVDNISQILPEYTLLIGIPFVMENPTTIGTHHVYMQGGLAMYSDGYLNEGWRKGIVGADVIRAKDDRMSVEVGYLGASIVRFGIGYYRGTFEYKAAADEAWYEGREHGGYLVGALSMHFFEYVFASWNHALILPIRDNDMVFVKQNDEPTYSMSLTLGLRLKLHFD